MVSSFRAPPPPPLSLSTAVTSMSTQSPSRRPPLSPLTPQEIERRLGQPSPVIDQLSAFPNWNTDSATSRSRENSMERPLGAEMANVARRTSSSSGTVNHSGRLQLPTSNANLSSGEEDLSDHGHAGISPTRASTHLPLSVISEAESGTDSDSSSIAAQRSDRNQPHSTTHSSDPKGLQRLMRVSLEGNRMTDHSAVKSGYLMKKGERRKAWKKRWFVLRGGQVAMYKNDKEYRLLRLIPLSEIHACAPIELKKHSFTFGIVTPERTYYVQADSNEAVAEWCQTVDRAKEEIAARGTVTSLDLTPTPSGNYQASSLLSSFSPLAVSNPIASTSSPIITATTSTAPLPMPIPLSSNSNHNQPYTSYPPSSLSPTVPMSSSIVSSSVVSSSSNSHFSPSNSYKTTSTVASSTMTTHAPPPPRVPPNSYAGAGLGWDFGVDVDGVDAGLARARLVGHSDSQRVARSDSNGRNRAGSDSSIERVGSNGAPGGIVSTMGPEYFESSRSRPVRNTSFGSTSVGGSAGIISSSEDEGVSDSYETSSNTRRTTFSPVDRSEIESHRVTPLVLDTTAGNPAVTSTSIGFSDPNKVILSGYLMKQGKRRNWRNRWFVLTSSQLVYSRSHMDTRVHRSIPVTQILDAIEYTPSSPLLPSSRKQLTSATPSSTLPSSQSLPSATLGVVNDKNYQHCFKIITPKRTYLVCAPLEEEEIKWLAALQCLVARKGGIIPSTSSPSQPAPSDLVVVDSVDASIPPSSFIQPPNVHGRQRSVTDAARAVVREVEKRFHPSAVA